MKIKILGAGCKNCISLGENVEIAFKKINKAVEIEKVTEMEEIMKYGVMSTPALVIDETVVSYGKVLKPKEIIKLIENL